MAPEQTPVKRGRGRPPKSERNFSDTKAELIKKLMEPLSPGVTGECRGALDLVLKLDAETYGQFAAWAAQSGFEPTADGIAKWAVQVAHMAGEQGSRSPRKTQDAD